MRSIVEAARFTPGLWLLNRFADIWVDGASALAFAVRPPEDYVAVHTRFFDHLESGAADAAVALMADYLDRHDQKLVSVMQAFA